MTSHTFYFIVPLLICQLFTSVHANTELKSQEYQITASDGTELNFTRHPAKGDRLIVWIAPGYDIQERSAQMTRQLAQDGFEIWEIDLAEALFLPHSTEQMRAFPGHYVADLIQAAHQETGKKILLTAQSYSAIPLLRGVRAWQTRKPSTAYVVGAILFSPDLYTTVPSLGEEPEYLPIASASNIPIMIFQDGLRGNRWYVDKLVETLVSGGSQPMLKILPGVTGLFYSEDTAPATLQALANLPRDIKTGIQLLEKLPAPLTAAPMEKPFRPVGSGIDDRLKPFKGKFLPFPIDLQDAFGKRYQRGDYKGQVTVVNFWASWCPPCVEEIPSLNRLRDKMRDYSFELVSVNYAESPDTVLEFLNKVDVNFPVLLDETGKVSAHWKIIAFPSTFIIGPDGRIHYGVNAAIHWDSPDVVSKLKALFKQ
ncbi:MAG TPA: TlpA disulfide reductase family protein [Gammaproteobacteria bacterium]